MSTVDPHTLLNEALRLQEAGQLPAAESLCRQVTELDPNCADALHLLGAMLHLQGRSDEGVAFLQRAIAADPRNSEFHINLGKLFRDGGRLQEAIESFRQAVALNGDSATAHFNLGQALNKLGAYQEALPSLQRSVELDVNYHLAWCSLGNALAKLNRADEAESAYTKVPEDSPVAHIAMTGRATLMLKQGRGEEGEQLLSQLLARQYSHKAAEIVIRRQIERGALGEADDLAAKALEHIDRTPPATAADTELSARVLVAIGFLRFEQGDDQRHAAMVARAESVAPGNQNIQVAVAESDYRIGLLDESRERCRRILELEPEREQVASNLGLIELTQGDFTNGWKHYRHRFAHSAFWLENTAKLEHPRWNGEDLNGKTILLVSEQGLGDNLQFVRYAETLKETYDCQVWMVAIQTSIGILSTYTGVDRWFSSINSGEAYDFWVPLLDVPGLMGHNDPQDFPAPIPYLRFGSDRVARWEPHLGPADSFRIGVAWQGNRLHALDHLRSFPLIEMAPLGEVDGVSLVSLQKGFGSQQIEAAQPSLSIRTLDESFDDEGQAFLDTAAVLSRLDLLITCDSAAAHLAGALGRPVWIALNHVADWRWGLDHDQSPWYPTARLHRKARGEDWRALFCRMADDLKEIDLAQWRQQYPLAEIVQAENSLPQLLSDAVAAHQTGDTDRAELIYREVIAREPANANAHQLLAVLRAAQDDTEEAKRGIFRAIAIDRQSMYLNNLARIYEREGNRNEAIRWYEQSVRADPSASSVWERLATLHRESGDEQRAADCESRFIQPTSAASDQLTKPVDHAPADRTPIECGELNRMVQARHGWMLYNRHDRYIGKSIEMLGEFSEGEVELFSQLVRPGDVVVEAGSNIGSHTVPLAKLVGPTGRVLAFEPQRIVFQALAANVALNSLTQVDARWCGLGDHEGQLIVPQMNFRAPNNFGGLSLESQSKGDPVPMVTVDSLGLSSLRLLKADVEGMELAVLKGARETISRLKPALYLENDRQDRSAELMQFIASIGYRMFVHQPRMFRKDNFFGCQENPFGNIVSINLLAIHASVAASIQGLEEVTAD